MSNRASEESVQQVCNRLSKASEAGINVRAVARRCGIGNWRMANIASSNVKEKSYAYRAAITDDECALINKALDEIKEII